MVENGCGKGKINYPDRKAAKQAAVSQRQRGIAERAKTYWCEHCDAWHTTRQSGKSDIRWNDHTRRRRHLPADEDYDCDDWGEPVY